MGLILKEANLGDAGSGSTLTIDTPAPNGFFASAQLDRDGKIVDQWDSDELCGKSVTRRLVAAGAYTLRVSLGFTGKKDTSVPIAVSVGTADGPISSKTVTLSGRTHDLGRAKVFTNITGGQA